MRSWSFLTNHAQVLLCIAHDPGIRLREIGESVGITERAAHRIVGELADAGYISRERTGRRNHYTIQSHLPLPDRLVREQKIGDLLGVLAGRS
jgi:DNA-binding IclR family transcriptional regulator